MTTQTFSNEGQSNARSADRATSSKQLWTGRVLTGLASMFMLVDGIMKVVKPAPVLQASIQMGYPVATLTGIGLALITCTVLYAIPRTAILGAILLTGYLGGAVASQVRASAGWFELVFPLLFAVLVWGALWLRDYRLRRILTLAFETSDERN